MLWRPRLERYLNSCFLDFGIGNILAPCFLPLGGAPFPIYALFTPNQSAFRLISRSIATNLSGTAGLTGKAASRAKIALRPADAG